MIALDILSHEAVSYALNVALMHNLHWRKLTELAFGTTREFCVSHAMRTSPEYEQKHPNITVATSSYQLALGSRNLLVSPMLVSSPSRGSFCSGSKFVIATSNLSCLVSAPRSSLTLKEISMEFTGFRLRMDRALRSPVRNKATGRPLTGHSKAAVQRKPRPYGAISCRRIFQVYASPY